MSEKEENILNEIIEYYKKNMAMPSIRYLKSIFNYKSTNTIFKYLKRLERKGYLTRNICNNLIINDSSLSYNKSLRKIRIINRKNMYVHIFLEKNNDYLAYEVNNYNLSYLGIIKGDILVLNTKAKINNNEIGLFVIDNKYRIMKYNYHDGFYVLSDNDEIVLNKINLIGKIIMLERKIKNHEV